MNEQDLINAFAAITAVLCSLTIAYVCYQSFKRKDYRFLGLALLGLLVLVWYAAGYIAIVAGLVINTAVYFRPVFPFMAGIFTWAIVGGWQSREYKRVAREVEQSLERMEETRAVIEQWEVG